MEEEKNSKQKPHTSFNRRLSVAKTLRGTLQRPRKMLKILFYRGNMTKRGIWQRVLRYINLLILDAIDRIVISTYSLK